MTCCTTSIAFPTCRFMRVASNDDTALRAIGNSICDAHRNLARLTTLGADSIDGIVTRKRLFGVAGIQNSITSRIPAGNTARRGLERKTLSNTSGRRHYVDFTWALFTAHKSE